MSRNATETETGLSPKQEKAIEALLIQPTVEKAAKLAGVNKVTIFRWLNDEQFAAVYRAARSRLLEGTLQSLQAASGDAVETLKEIMQDGEAPTASRVTAARSILEFSLKAREVLEVEERLRLLEMRFLVPVMKKA